MNVETEKLLLRVSETQKLLSLSRSTIYAMVASGELPSVRIGRAVRVPVDALKQWVEQQTNKENKE